MRLFWLFYSRLLHSFVAKDTGKSETIVTWSTTRLLFTEWPVLTSEAPLVNSSGIGPYSFSSDGSARLNQHDLLNSYRAAAVARTHVITTSTSAGHLHQDMNGISVIELPGYPPPPYRSRTSINNLDPETDHMNQMNHSNTLQVVTAGDPTVNNGDSGGGGVRPSSAIVVRKPFWRKLSQWMISDDDGDEIDQDYRRYVEKKKCYLQRVSASPICRYPLNMSSHESIRYQFILTLPLVPSHISLYPSISRFLSHRLQCTNLTSDFLPYFLFINATSSLLLPLIFSTSLLPFIPSFHCSFPSWKKIRVNDAISSNWRMRRRRRK